MNLSDKESIIFTSQYIKDMNECSICYVVVNLLRLNLQTLYVWLLEKAEIYNHSGDDGKEDPPVPIPNTEVKLFYAESTCRLLPGG